MVTFRRRLYGSIILVAGYFCFLWNLWGSQVVYAEGEGQINQADVNKHLSERTFYLKTAVKVFYVILRPAIAAAGLAMDNSLVYGEFLGFDAALWNLWNLTRNIANYALWFLFLFSLFQLLINQKQTKDMAKVIKSTLIAGVGIQASWFITAAAVDISTIATYGIGGLPVTIIDQVASDKKLNIPVLHTEVITNMNSLDDSYVILSTAKVEGEKPWKISQCEIWDYHTISDPSKKENLILGRERIFYTAKDGEEIETQEKLCHHMGNIYRFKPNDAFKYEGNTSEQKQQSYKAKIAEYKSELQGNKAGNANGELVRQGIEAGIILQIPNTLFVNTGDNFRIFTGNKDWTTKQWTGSLVWSNGEYGFDLDLQQLSWQNGIKLTLISDLFEESKSYVGVFSALYGNLLDSAEVGLTNDSSLFSIFLNSAISALYAAILLVPLLCLVVVLFGRILLLWVVIAISPIIVLLNVFKDNFKKLEVFTGNDGRLSLKTICMILVAPVLVSFAVSLSTMFIILLKNVVSWDFSWGEAHLSFALIEINIRGWGAAFSKLLISIMGVGLVWFLLFWAVKANKIGKSVGDWAQKWTQAGIGTIPLLPIPNGQGGIGVGVGTATNVISRKLGDMRRKSDVDEGREKKLYEFMNGISEGAGDKMYPGVPARVNANIATANKDMDATERAAYVATAVAGWTHTTNVGGTSVEMTREHLDLTNAQNLKAIVEHKTEGNAEHEKSREELLNKGIEHFRNAPSLQEAQGYRNALRGDDKVKEKLKDRSTKRDSKTYAIIGDEIVELMEKLKDARHSIQNQTELKKLREKLSDEEKDKLIASNQERTLWDGKKYKIENKEITEQ